MVVVDPTLASAGSSAVIIAMMAIATGNSIKVKPRHYRMTV
jgi:hypothetical protein